MGLFSALWCSRRRSRVQQAAAPTEATQMGDVDVRAASPIHSSAVPSPSNVDVPAPAPSQGDIPSTAPEAAPTEAQITIPQGQTLASNEWTRISGDLGFNPGQAQPAAYLGPQSNHLAEPPGGRSSPGTPNGLSHNSDWSSQYHPSNPTQPRGQGLLHGSNSTAPPTPRVANSSITVPSPSAINGNGTPTLTPIAQPTSIMSELPASFLSDDFMQSVAAELDNFDPQGLSRPGETGIDFEQFREWFEPSEEKVNGR